MGNACRSLNVAARDDKIIITAGEFSAEDKAVFQDRAIALDKPIQKRSVVKDTKADSTYFVQERINMPPLELRSVPIASIREALTVPGDAVQTALLGCLAALANPAIDREFTLKTFHKLIPQAVLVDQVREAVRIAEIDLGLVGRVEVVESNLQAILDAQAVLTADELRLARMEADKARSLYLAPSISLARAFEGAKQEGFGLRGTVNHTKSNDDAWRELCCDDSHVFRNLREIIVMGMIRQSKFVIAENLDELAGFPLPALGRTIPSLSIHQRKFWMLLKSLWRFDWDGCRQIVHDPKQNAIRTFGALPSELVFVYQYCFWRLSTCESLSKRHIGAARIACKQHLCNYYTDACAVATWVDFLFSGIKPVTEDF